MKSFISNAFSCLILTLCVIGFMLEIYTIASEYFSYPITNRIEVVRNDVHRYPAITFCFELQQIAKYDALVNMWQFYFFQTDLKNKSANALRNSKEARNRVKLVLRNLPIATRNQVTLNLSDYIGCSYLTGFAPDANRLPNSGTFIRFGRSVAERVQWAACAADTYYYRDLKCVAYFSIANSLHAQAKTIADSFLAQTDMEIIAKFDFSSELKHASVFYQLHNESRLMIDWKYMKEIGLSRTNEILVTYERIARRLLRALRNALRKL